MDGARDRLHDHGEVIPDQHLADRTLAGLPREYEHVRNCRQPARLRLGGNQKPTQRNIHGINPARTSLHGTSVWGRGVAMQARKASLLWYSASKASEYGHYRNECLQKSDTESVSTTGGNRAGTKTVAAEATAVEQWVATAVAARTVEEVVAADVQLAVDVERGVD